MLYSYRYIYTYLYRKWLGYLFSLALPLYVVSL